MDSLLISPYGAPEIILSTTDCLPEDGAKKIIRYLIEKGLLLEDLDNRNYEI